MLDCGRTWPPAVIDRHISMLERRASECSSGRPSARSSQPPGDPWRWRLGRRSARPAAASDRPAPTLRFGRRTTGGLENQVARAPSSLRRAMFHLKTLRPCDFFSSPCATFAAAAGDTAPSPASFDLCADGGIGGLKRRLRPRGTASGDAKEREQDDENANCLSIVGHHSPIRASQLAARNGATMLILEPRRGRGGDAAPHLVPPGALPP
jgi:hypothetical protein